MKSATTKQFWKCFDALPERIQKLAAEGFEHWKRDSHHPGLHFKPIHGVVDMYSVRVGTGWRAVGRRRGETIYWMWIGSHADYDTLLTRL
ncbi:MAG: hypothetical protein EXQ89_07365 [Rhodospirillaceae bacterium]|nr:hypothetical protein [Rhodospirillaceae bacterium]